MKSTDQRFMERALRLAKKGIGTTSPNPRVGAVIVREGQVVGQGWHKKPGEHHAEVLALKKAGDNAKGSNLYVTLEPCSTTGRTPPCTDEIIKAEIGKVIIGSLDPNPKHSGSGTEILRAHGIDVETGVMDVECRKLNEGFEKYIKRGLPFVTVKAAMSLDGKIATSTGQSKWITNERSREHAHVMRNESDAIMVGIGTVKKDDPHLTVRCKTHTIHDPRRIVVDARAEIDIRSNLFSQETAATTIIAATESADREKLEQIRSRGAVILICADSNGRVDLKDLMKKLAKKGIIYVLVEGGGTLIAGLLENRLVDKIALFYAPILIGGKNSVNLVMGEGVSQIDKAVRIDGITVTEIDNDFLLEGYVRN